MVDWYVVVGLFVLMIVCSVMFVRGLMALCQKAMDQGRQDAIDKFNQEELAALEE